MKANLIAFAAFMMPFVLQAQDITGLWTGTMKNDSTGTVQDYEIYISKEKGKFTGYSHTWFEIGGVKYYGVKKMKVNIAKDGKIVLLDAELRENNYPFVDKNVKQLDILDLSGSGSEAGLSGLFVTNCTKSWYELTGKVELKRSVSMASSSLMRYLEKEANGAGAITAAKQP